MLWNTIKTFDNPIDAHLYKSKLESEGIKVFLKDEQIVSLNPLYSLSVKGIKLQVQQHDINKVLDIIRELESSKPMADDNTILKCPNCSSDHLYTGFKSLKGSKGILSAVISFTMLVFPIYLKNVYKCKECNHEFKM